MTPTSALGAAAGTTGTRRGRSRAGGAERGFLGRLGARSVYLVAGLPLAVVRFAVLLAMFLLGVATTVTVIGLPVLATTMRVARGFATLDRARLSHVQGWPAQRPDYGVATGRTWFGRLLAPLRRGQSWADWAHGVFGLIPALIGFVLTVVWWAAGVGGTLAFLWQWAIPRGPNEGGLSEILGLGSGWVAEARLTTALGLVFLVTLPAVVKAAAAMDAGLARLMLTSDRVTELQGQVSDMTRSRDAAVSAEASALRRLERDIHDGPQQRLVRLAMDLSTVQRRLAKDAPGDVQPLLADALAQARETLDELRALSRGIAPPVLADRGLPAALAAVAGRSPVPVDLDVDLPDGIRLPSMVENAAYFCVAEALTNVVKHSTADHCRVQVTMGADRAAVHVLVSDNGIGGAHQSKGHGLAGLADRVRALGGTFEVESPTGGPTVLAVGLPCGS